MRGAVLVFAVVLMLVCAPLGAFAGEQDEAQGLLDTSYPDEVFADERSIYIGDIISLEIEAEGFSSTVLRELFKEFEIVEIVPQAIGHVISIRTFLPGEHRVFVGDKEIVIDVRSTLDDIIRDDVFEGEAMGEYSATHVNLRIMFLAAVWVFAVSGAVLLVKKHRKTKTENIRPYLLFVQRCTALSPDSEGYFVDLTFYFKEYVGGMYGRRIIGKTSGEIMAELADIGELERMFPEIRAWLTECDRLKFTGAIATESEKSELCKKLQGLVSKIDSHIAQNSQVMQKAANT